MRFDGVPHKENQVSRVHRFHVSHALAVVLGASSLFTAACTLIQRDELNAEQCGKDADCAKYGAQYKEYVCEQDICVPFTCMADKDCTDRGGALATYVCSDEKCEPPECTENAQCTAKLGPTALCTKGRCNDPVWGCLSDGMSPHAAGTDVHFRAEILDYMSQLKPDGVKTKVCAKNDFACAYPYPKKQIFDLTSDSYVDLKLGPVGGQNQGFDGFIWATGEGYMDERIVFPFPLTHDYLNKPSDITLAMVGLEAPKLFGGALSKTVSDGSHIFSLRAFDCQGKVATGLALTVDNEPDAFEFFVDKSNAPTSPSADIKGTSSAYPIVGIANLTGTFFSIHVMNANVTPPKELVPVLVTLPADPNPTFILGIVYAAESQD
jgi:hypothetical protein